MVKPVDDRKCHSNSSLDFRFVGRRLLLQNVSFLNDFAYGAFAEVSKFP